MASKSDLTYDQKAEMATAVLEANGYTPAEIKKIIIKSFGKKPSKSD